MRTSSIPPPENAKTFHPCVPPMRLLRPCAWQAIMPNFSDRDLNDLLRVIDTNGNGARGAQRLESGVGSPLGRQNHRLGEGQRKLLPVVERSFSLFHGNRSSLRCLPGVFWNMCCSLPPWCCEEVVSEMRVSRLEHFPASRQGDCEDSALSVCARILVLVMFNCVFVCLLDCLFVGWFD